MMRLINMLVKKSKKDPFSVLGIFIAIAGIFISTCWDVLSQYDDRQKAIRDLYIDGYDLNWEDLKSKSDTLENNIIFIVDDSKSMKNAKNPLLEYYKSVITSFNNILNNNGWGSHTGEKQQGYQYSDLIKARLKVLLYRLHQENVKGYYSIIKFSNYPEIVPEHYNKNISYVNLKTSCKEVDNLLQFDGDTTKFIHVLKYLKENYRDKKYDSYEKSKYTFIFLSDYLHDFKSKEKEIEEIKECFKEIEQYSIFSNLYIISEDIKPYEGAISIKEIVQDIGNFNKQFININSDEYYISKVKRENPFIFHYSSYLFSNSPKTTMDFGQLETDKKIKLKVKDCKFTEDDRQDFFYVFDCDTTRFHSENFNSLTLKKEKNKIDFLMKGHIPSQYPLVELVVRDVDQHIEYWQEIVFFKELPKDFKWIILLFFGLLGLYLILLFTP